jgi:8-oxo-dGTP diphosphatase
MLHMHKKLKMWLQFGGHVELHENPWQAVTHELAEESGYELSQLQLMQPKNRIRQTPDSVMHPVAFYDQTHSFPGDPNAPNHHHTDRGYVFFTDQAPANAIGQNESTTIRPFSLAEIRALPANAMPSDLGPICDYILRINLDDWVLENAADQG